MKWAIEGGGILRASFGILSRSGALFLRNLTWVRTSLWEIKMSSLGKEGKGVEGEFIHEGKIGGKRKLRGKLFGVGLGEYFRIEERERERGEKIEVEEYLFLWRPGSFQIFKVTACWIMLFQDLDLWKWVKNWMSFTVLSFDVRKTESLEGFSEVVTNFHEGSNIACEAKIMVSMF